MTNQDCVIVWFRRDLRVADNPALDHAASTTGTMLPVFILDEDESWAPGGASRWWLHESLDVLGRDVAARGSNLLLYRGRPRDVLRALVQETGADCVVFNRVDEPGPRERDQAIRADLENQGVAVVTYNASMLLEPGSLANKSGDPFRVFSPFWKALVSKFDQVDPLSAPPTLPPTPKGPAGDALTTWSLQPSRPDWAGGLRNSWTPGEAGANDRLDAFLDGAVANYKTDRDRPGVDGTARLSPHLHWGEISPRQVWHRTRARMAAGDVPERDGWAFLRELGWREFSYHLLHHFPRLPEQNFNPRFDDFPWANDSRALDRWQRGQTGYPIVDAGMRELWQTGYMHNRVRMIVASFLVKHLLVPWQTGAAWFWDTLVDADLANNAASWQWVAGSGADAAPYFRIFNPVLQGEKFDGNGDYVRRFVPELGKIPDKFIHKPWTAPAKVLDYAGIRLGRDYPEPMVDHGAARARALAAFETLKKRKAT